MPELGETGPFDGLDLPLAHGATRLDPLAPGPLHLIAPLAGQTAAVAAALGAEALPIGGTADLPIGRLVWFGLDQWLLQGTPPAGLAGAAITEQGDGWAGLQLAGPDAAAVLARLVPIDLHPSVFPPGRAARTLLGHMMALLVAVPDGVQIFVMRSFAATAVHDIAMSMRSAAAIAAMRAAP